MRSSDSGAEHTHTHISQALVRVPHYISRPFIILENDRTLPHPTPSSPPASRVEGSEGMDHTPVRGAADSKRDPGLFLFSNIPQLVHLSFPTQTNGHTHQAAPKIANATPERTEVCALVGVGGMSGVFSVLTALSRARFCHLKAMKLKTFYPTDSEDSARAHK